MWLDVFADASVPIGLFVLILYVRKFVNKVSITLKRKKSEKKVKKD